MGFVDVGASVEIRSVAVAVPAEEGVALTLGGPTTVFTGDTTVYAHWTVKDGSASSASTTAPAAPAPSNDRPEILDHLGVFVIAGVLIGTLTLASMV